MSSPLGSNVRWWKEDESESACSALFAIADYIRTTQQWQTDADHYHARMYAGARADGWLDVTASEVTYEYQPTHLARNVARSAVNTYVAKVFKHRPLPEVLANKGNWRDQRRARKMTQLVEGEFDRHKIFKKHARVIGRDSAIYGRGHLKIDLERSDSKTLRVERLFARECFVDHADAKYGEPRNFYNIRTADRGVIIESFATDDKGKVDEELADRITAAGKDDTVVLSGYDLIATVDRVRVVESWHLCDNVEAHEADAKHDCNGRHMVCVRGVPLVDEVWEFDRFPIATLNYLEPLEGYFGQGLCEELEGWAYEQNLMSEKVSDGHYFAGGGIIFLPDGSDLAEEDFTNGNWKVLRHAPGLKPEYFNPEPLHPATYQYLRDINGDALGEVGLSQMSAQSQKPAGVTAAVALNTLDDIETERFGMQGFGYAQWCVDVAELFLMWIAHIVKKHGDYTSRVPLRGGILELSWKDVSVDNYVVRTMSSALMRLQPSARKQMAQDLFNAGRIDGVTFLRYIGDGAEDIEAEIDIQTADRLKVDEQLEAMLDAEEPTNPDAYLPPSPYSTELAWAMRRAQMRIAQAETQGCPEENIQLVREWVLDCDQLLNGPQQAGPQAAATPVGPGGPGMMPTTAGQLPPMAPGAPPGPPMTPPAAPPGAPLQ